MDTQPETIEVHGTSERKPHPGRRMSEAEFVAWADEDTRAEWVDGEVIVMSPASFDHIWIADFLTATMRIFVEEHDLGGVFSEGTTRFSVGERVCRRVPDVLFVAQDRLHLLRKTHLEGPPDLIVEVVSDDSFTRDWREKYLEYEQAGVREYWVVDPLARRVEAYALGEDRNYARIPESGQTIHSAVLDGFFLRPAWLFQEPRPKTRDVLQEIGIV
jgi:Uma2 family endonuclease